MMIMGAHLTTKPNLTPLELNACQIQSKNLLETLKYCTFLEKHYFFLLFVVYIKKKFKKEKLVETSKIFGLVENI